MLSIVSKALRGFLQASAPPPSPKSRPDEWVRIGDLSDETSRDHPDCIIVSMYMFEPDPLARSQVPNNLHPGQRPLVLTLHYAMRFASRSHEQCMDALSIVLRAFHSNPTIDVATHAPGEDLDALGNAAPRTIRMDLETPEPSTLDMLWGRSRRTMPIAAYYRASVALIHNWDQLPGKQVEALEAPDVGRAGTPRPRGSS